MSLIKPEPCAVLIEKKCSCGSRFRYVDTSFIDDGFQNKGYWKCKGCGKYAYKVEEVFKFVELNDQPYTVEMEVLEDA